MPNSLTRDAGLQLGPVVLETFVKHYYEKLSNDTKRNDVPLRKEKLLYDEVFHIVKNFLAQASDKHTVEELQSFSNTRTPSTPASHVVRVTVPLSSCDAAAKHLIRAFGGEEAMKRTIGGVKWWQVRGIRGISAEWMCAKKDLDDVRHRAREAHSSTREGTKARATFSATGLQDIATHAEKQSDAHDGSHNQPPTSPASNSSDDGDIYTPEMDGMKCILFFHGGGYYFGSVDQERYTIQRMARKIHGRALAVSYRLAPQYPFPCAIQDILASYLYLIDPPSSALHAPVSPSDIVIAGDSAGGGLALALLQVLRDCSLPLPAGGILISPWCDLTHSFPSIFQNTATDVIPATGLSMHKPSALWPPPDDDTTYHMREGLRATVRKAFHRPRRAASNPDIRRSGAIDASERPRDQSLVSLPLPNAEADQTVVVDTERGVPIEITSQLQLYVPNGLISHPLVSSALSYLGGLPPLLFIASDREVLRDEIIYAAHRAAYPERFPVKEEVRSAYPAFKGLSEADMKPTSVHLQVYDDTAHVLPVLFPFAQPAKYCFRAMATFCLQVFHTAPSEAVPIIEAPLHESPKEEKKALPGDEASAGKNESDVAKATRSGDRSVGASELKIPANEASERPQTLSVTHTESTELIDGHSAGISDQLRRDNAPSSSGVAVAFHTQQSSRLGPLLPQDEGYPSTSTGSPQISSSASDGQFPLRGPPSPKSIHLRRLARHKSDGFIKDRPSFKALSSVVARYGTLRRQDRPRAREPAITAKGRNTTSGSEDVAGPRGKNSVPHASDDKLAGNTSVYGEHWARAAPSDMIRERVSTRGVIRPLEVEPELSAFSVPPERIGTVPAAAIQRYLDAKRRIDRKYARTLRRIARERDRAIANADAVQPIHMQRLQHYLERQHKPGKDKSVLGLSVLGASWSLAWALDVEERPPPSSIVARRDTKEALALAQVADQAIFVRESSLNANNLWALVLNFFTAAPQDKNRELEPVAAVGGGEKRRASLRFWKAGNVTKSRGARKDEQQGSDGNWV